MLDKIYVPVVEIPLHELDGRFEDVMARLDAIMVDLPPEIRAEAFITTEMWEDDGETSGAVTVFYYRPKTAVEMEEQRIAIEEAARMRVDFLARRGAPSFKGKATELEPKMTIPLI